MTSRTGICDMGMLNQLMGFIVLMLCNVCLKMKSRYWV